MANSKIYLGSTNIGSLFQGADDISIYLGDEKVYPLGEPTFQGKWLATYSDSHTESAACDSSTAITKNEIILTDLESIEVGNCTKKIDDGALSGCTSLTSCTIGSDVNLIGNSAFRDCSGLTSIEIPNSVTSIGYYAFQYCSGLTSLTIGSGVTTLGQSAFSNCNSLTSITINATTPPSLVRWEFNNTNDCPIYVPCESVEAYKSASGWSTYASRITCVQPPVFEGKWKATYSGGETYELACDGDATLTTTNTKPTGYEYSAMTEAIIGDCVTTINGRILWGCTSLSSVTIPDTVTSIGVYAFFNCSSLTSIDIPSGVTSIANGTFEDCTSLTSITVNAVTPPTLGDYVFYNTNDCPIYVPSASLTVYQNAWSDYASRIQAIP